MKKNFQKLILLLCISFFVGRLNAQVDVTATSGTLNGSYINLSSAFTAINTGTHGGNITIDISASFTDVASAVLNSSGAGLASYNSILIRPSANGVTITFNTVSGRGAIELNGADNVTIDGDNPNSGGINRDLSIINGASATTTYTSVVRIALSILVTTADNIIVKNCNISGSAIGRNIAGATSTIGSEHTTYGILVGGGASTILVTNAPSPITSVNTTIGVGISALNANFENNFINTCARGISVNGSSATLANNLQIKRNIIGSLTNGNTSTVYSRGISIQGFTNAILTENTVQNMAWFGGTQMMGISLGDVSASGSAALIEKNIVNGVLSQNTITYGVYGINLAGGNNHILRNNFVSGMNGDMSGGFAFDMTYGLAGIRISSGTGHSIQNNTVNLHGTRLGVANSSLLTTAFGIVNTSQTGCDVRNNLFSNTLVGGTTSVANVSVYLPTGATSAMNLTWNNNFYYSGTDSARQGLAQRGTTAGTGFYLASNFNSVATTPVNNFRAYSSALNISGLNDNASGASTVVAPFLSTSNLHISIGAPNISDIDGKAQVIVGVAADIDGDIRDVTTPDIGADEFIPASVCLGTPTLSNSLSTATSVCSGVNFTLSLDVVYTESGYTYQWESSADNVTFSPISGATSATLNTSQTAATYYHCIITCTNSGLSTTSASVQVTMNPFTSCYCTATFPSAVEPITLVNFAGINNSTSATLNGTPATEDFTSITANVTQGTSYPIIVKGNTDGSFTDYIRVFIDFNQNGSFADAGESFDIGTITNSTGIDAIQATANILIPFTSTPGVTRMRVTKLWNAYAASCNAAGYGQAEDYSINIAAAVNCSGTPTPGTISTASLNVCPSSNVNLNLTGQTTDVNITYQWESSSDGVTYTPIGGATNSFYSTTISTVTYFQAVVTCTSSGLSATTPPVQFNINPFTSCYCTATFPDGVEPITLVNFAGINNSTSATLNGTPATEDFTSITATVSKGVSYPIIVKGNTGGPWTDYIRVYIDFNQNGSFADLGESFDIGTITNSTGVDAIQATANIAIPMSATTGVTGMRVIKLWNAYALPCNAAGFGQAEDYTIDIQPCVPPASVVLVSGDTDATICPNTSVTFTAPTALTYYDFQVNSISVQTGATNTYTNFALANNDVVTVIAGYNATCATTSNSLTILHHSVPVANTIGTDALCNGAANGSIDLTVTGGTPSYIYFWSNFANTQDLAAVAAGTYTVTVIDANGCSGNSTISISEPSAISVSASSVNASCFSLNDGSINITVSGGTLPYTFDWDNDGTGDFNDTEDLASLAAGVYAGVVKDDNGCTASISITITEPTLLVANAVVSNITCFGLTNGSIDITVSGGTTPYAFDWDNDAIGDFDDTEDLNALSSGNYNLVVEDANGCVANSSSTIIEPAILSASVTATAITCNGLTDGELNLTVTGGTIPYSFDWDNDGTGDFNDTEDITGLSAGTYNLVIIDANFCGSVSGGTISEPTAFNVSLTSTNVSCFGLSDGSVDLTISGATPPYTFDWDNDGTGDFNDTEDITGLSAGTYNLVIIDANFCGSVSGGTISEPTAFNVSLTSTNVSCFGLSDGSVDLTISGATPPYTFDWDNDGTGDFDDTEDLSSIPAGNYVGVVIDANGCTDGGTVTINEPTEIIASISASDITCNGLTDGAIDLTITGGSGIYTIDWDNDGTGDFNDTEDITGLSAGTYNLVIIDANFCGSVSGGTISEPTAFNVSLTSTNVSCFGLSDGSVDLTISGATPPYTFDWDNDGTGDFDDTEDLSSIPAGNYVGVVIDANGCTDGGTVTINEPTEIIASISASDITCNGLTDGAIDLTITGGSGIYTIDWDNDGTGDFDDTEDLSVLSAGIYTVVVKDNTNCSVTNFDTIVEPSGISISAIATDVICNGLTDGSIDITISGGSTPFTFDWDNDGTGDFDDTEDLTGLASGTFAVVVNDANGCSSASSSATVNEPSLLSISSVITNANCDNSSDGEINLTITGGTGAYAILWSTTATTEDLTGLADGSYSVTVTDDNGCTANSNETVGFNFAAPVVTLSVTPAVVCNTASAMNLGGESPSGGSWSGTGVTGSSFNPSVAGPGTFTITYTLTDGNGCTNSAQDDIQVDDCSAITENSETGFTVYPNPSLGIFNINTTSEKGNIIVRDAIGKVVYTSTFNTSKLSLDLSSMARGVYYITLETSEGSIIQKIVKD